MEFSGVLNVLKPTGMTSHDVVNKIRKIAKQKKVGHTGTLDPDVAGVLPICLGKGTKISNYLMEGNKKYLCDCHLGIVTDTYDMYGNVLKESNTVNINLNDVEKALAKLKTIKRQKPPIYSAVKYKGKKLYEYARKNQNVEIKEKDVNILAIDLINFSNNIITFTAEVSKGTYMRSLCYDLGKLLDTFGTMGNLIRLESKGLNIFESFTLEELEEKALNNKLDSCIVRIEEALKLPSISISNKDGKKILNGLFIEVENTSLKEPFYIFDEEKLLGFGEFRGNKLKIKKRLC
jgi:tRNA pseudouridine55 synthase